MLNIPVTVSHRYDSYGIRTDNTPYLSCHVCLLCAYSVHLFEAESVALRKLCTAAGTAYVLCVCAYVRSYILRKYVRDERFLFYF